MPYYAIQKGSGIITDSKSQLKKIIDGEPFPFRTFSNLDSAKAYLKNAQLLLMPNNVNEPDITTFDYIVYTDGACDINPGGKGGYGVVVLKGDKKTELSGAFFHTTNNRMEVMAAIKAIESLPEGVRALVYSDSQYLVKTMEGEYRKKTNLDLWKEISRVTSTRDIVFRWTRGHNGTTYNERCDELATEAIATKDCDHDKGYTGKKVFAVSLPKYENDTPYDSKGKTAVQEAAQRGCNLECTKQIREFYKRADKHFGAYVKLKTFGNDTWSNRTVEEMSKHIPIEEYEYITSCFEDEKNTASALRWRLRGLTVNDAVKKEKTSMEISLQCEKKHRQAGMVE